MNIKIEDSGNNKPYDKRKTTDCIILHHAAAVKCTPSDIVRYHLARGFNGAGYNFFVSKDGSIHQMRPIWAAGAHTIGCNYNSIGICGEGNFEIESIMPEAEVNSLAEIINYCNEYYKTRLDLYGHRQKSATACPGKYFPLSKIENLVNQFKVKLNKSYPGRLLKYVPGNLMKCIDIKYVQRRLNDLGFNSGKTDGIFGLATLSSVISFQKSRGVAADGIIGPTTWHYLFS